jgi:hypothetical protein
MVFIAKRALKAGQKTNESATIDAAVNRECPQTLDGLAVAFQRV